MKKILFSLVIIATILFAIIVPIIGIVDLIFNWGTLTQTEVLHDVLMIFFREILVVGLFALLLLLAALTDEN